MLVKITKEYQTFSLTLTLGPDAKAPSLPVKTGLVRRDLGGKWLPGFQSPFSSTVKHIQLPNK